MNVTILGTGNMSRATAAIMLAGGNNVTLVSRNLEKAEALAKELAGKVKKGAEIKAVLAGGQILDPVVISTIYYPAVLEIVKGYGSQLSGKILVDLSNPLNQSYDDLATPPGSSVPEELTKVVPADTQVLKAFNTTFAGLLSQGHVANQPLDVLIAGDNADAKATLARLVEAGGHRPLDVGPLKRGRYLEGMALISISLQSKMEKPWMTAIKFVS
jgi:8-hydroxy-5-deazaflavin:NADPH oxidoreductase